MASRKPERIDQTELRLAETRSELDAVRKAISSDAAKDLYRLYVAVGYLDNAADPTPSYSLERPALSHDNFDKPSPGQHTRTHRGALRNITRQISRLADRAESAVTDPGWRPPRGLQCPGCRLFGKPGSKFCDGCGNELRRPEDE